MPKKFPVIIIPARMAAQRLPNKPMADFHGIPMVVRVWEQAMAANIADVFVACDSDEVYNAVERAGGKAIMTDPNIPKGTDRVCNAFLQLRNHKDYTHVINLQGDMPLVPKDSLRVLVHSLDKAKADIVTMVFRSADDMESTNYVKAVLAPTQYENIKHALYFSRNPVPYGADYFWHHVGVYCYTINALKKFAQYSVSYLESVESLEQLRALENGMTIDAVVIEPSQHFIGVDTMHDLENARKLYNTKC